MTNTAKKIEKVDDVERLNKRIKEVLYPDLEKCLMMWYFQTIVILPIISDDRKSPRVFSIKLVYFKYFSSRNKLRKY